MTGGALRALWPCVPLLIWGAHFALVYGTHAVGCERGQLTSMVPVIVGVVTVVALAALVPLARNGASGLDGGEDAQGFARWFATGAAVLAALAVLFQASAAFVLPACQ